MTHQTTFAHAEFANKKKTTRREKFLARMEEVIPQALAGGSLSVSLPGKAGRTYALQQAADVSAAAWTNVATFGPLATGQTVVLSHTNTASQGYYRATVQH